MTSAGGATVHNHSLANSLRLLLTRRFGSFWVGSLLSNLGTWMQQVAEPWLILSLSGSSFLLGLDAFVMDAPVWILTLLGGVLADRHDRRKVISSFQTIQMLCPILLVILILTGTIHVWMIIACRSSLASPMRSRCLPFNPSCRQSSLPTRSEPRSF